MKENPRRNVRILIIDDHPSTRSMISILLTQLGYDNISAARNGMEALQKLKTAKYDLILSDWHMPEMDGLALWSKMKEDETLRAIPLILVTAVNEVELVKMAISEGVADYMVKPITLQALTNKIEKALSNVPGSDNP